MAKTYKVVVTGNFPASMRRRAGIEVPAEGGYEGGLTKEQFAAIKADPQLHVSEAGQGGPSDDEKQQASQLVQDAQAKHDEIVAAADAEAKRIKDEAEAAAKTVREDADKYAKETRETADADAKAKKAGNQPAAGQGNK